MISIDAYRSAIGRHNNKRLRTSMQCNYDTALNDVGFYAILMPLILLLTYALLGILLLLTMIFSPHVTVIMSVFLFVNKVRREVKDRCTSTTRFEFSSTNFNKDRNFASKKRNVILRYICSALVIGSSVAFFSKNLPQTRTDDYQEGTMCTNFLKRYDLDFVELTRLIREDYIDNFPCNFENLRRPSKTDFHWDSKYAFIMGKDFGQVIKNRQPKELNLVIALSLHTS